MIDCKKDEKILVVPRTYFEDKYLIDGGNELNLNELKKILSNAVYGTRCVMEKNYNFKQIIPYITFISNNKILVYKRGSKGGEDRLHFKYSIGIGGHIDLEENNKKDPFEVLIDGAIREVKEEIGIEIKREDLKLKYFINDDSNDVGKVHFGIGFIVNSNFEKTEIGEKEIITDRKFLNFEEINNIYEHLETWSQIFFDGVIRKLIK